MTDDLRDVFEPLLSDPPHPPPPLDELQSRVDRRRQRRARAIGAGSIVAVVLVAAAVLALPRDTELRVGGEAPTTQPPPPATPTPVELVVTPESASSTTERNLEIRNTSASTYTTCGTYDLFRWDGERWAPIVQVFLGGGGTMFGRYDPSSTATECSWSPISVAAGDTTNLGFDPNSRLLWVVTATALPGIAPLADGWYELRDPAGVPTGVDPGAVGRFEITPPDDGSPSVSSSDPTVTTTQGQQSQTAGAISVDSTVDVWPGDPLTPTGVRLPDELVVVDDHTVAMTWRGGCAETADHIEVHMTQDEVELQLHLGTFVVGDCGATAIAPWVLAFDIGGGVGSRRVVARAGTGKVAAPSWEHPDDANPWFAYASPGPITAFAVQVLADERTAGSYQLFIPAPLAGSTELWCDVLSAPVGNRDVVMAREEPPRDDVTNGCGGDRFLSPATGRSLFGLS